MLLEHQKNIKKIWKRKNCKDYGGYIPSITRENKAKLNKLVEHIERLEGENSGIIDI